MATVHSVKHLKDIIHLPANNSIICEIVFDNHPEKVYSGGQQISGKVVLTLHKEKEIRGIYIKILGKGSCSWSEGTSDARRHFVGEENYLHEKFYLVEETDVPATYPPGLYKYPFEYKLPDDMQSTVRGKCGYVRYTITACLIRPLKSDHGCNEEFTVGKILDLNTMPELRLPIEENHSAKFIRCCICCWSSSKLNITAHLPASGFSVGETIPLRLTIDNKSSQDVANFQVQLMQIVTFQPYKNISSRKRYESKMIVEHMGRGCSSKFTDNQQINFAIPYSVQPTETARSFCKIQYEVVITGITNAFHVNPILKIPIIIGNVPLQNLSKLHKISNGDKKL